MEGCHFLEEFKAGVAFRRVREVSERRRSPRGWLSVLCSLYHMVMQGRSENVRPRENGDECDADDDCTLDAVGHEEAGENATTEEADPQLRAARS